MTDDLKPKVSVGAAIVKGTISQFPVLGPIIAELITQTIPDKRIERISGLLERLESRVAQLEPVTVRDRFNDPVFVDLLEDALFSASRAASSDRLGYIAEIVGRGLTRGDVQRVDRKYLLTILGHLNDVEVIVLCSYGKEHPEHDFRRLHADALSIPVVCFGEQDREKTTIQAVRESYRTHLESLGLLQRTYPFVNSRRLPEFDDDGRLKGGHLELSRFGWTFLREIGQPHDFDKDE